MAERAWRANPDGGGFAFIDDDQEIKGFKSMDFDPFWKAFETSRSQFPNRDFLLHMRIATHGTTDLANVHPFPVGDGKDTVMAHNGIIHSMPKDPLLSDTRLFVRDVLPELQADWLDKFWIRDMMEEWIGWSKLAFLTTNPSLAKQVYILNEHKGTEHEGMWMSNDSPLPKKVYAKKTKTVYPGAFAWDTDDWEMSENGIWKNRDHTKTAGKSPATTWEDQLEMEAYASIVLSDAEQAVADLPDNVVALPIGSSPFVLEDEYDGDEILDLLQDVRKDDGLIMRIAFDRKTRQFDCWGCDEWVNIDSGECDCWNKVCMDCAEIAGLCNCPGGFSHNLKEWEDLTEAEQGELAQKGV
jgi:hypothetical protein